MTIRVAALDDAPEIADLVAQLGYPAKVVDARTRLVRLLDRVDHAVLVAVEANHVVGLIHVCVVETLENEPHAEIRGLVVDETHRSRGAGRQLVAAAEEWAKERALPRVRVRSNVKRERTRKFYERERYEVTKVQNVFDKSLSVGRSITSAGGSG